MTEFENRTPFAMDASMFFGADGRARYRIILKAVFCLDPPEKWVLRPDLAHVRVVDEFYSDAPGSLRAESDLSDHKPATDICLLDPVAHAPGGRPSVLWQASIRVGHVQQTLCVHGPRSWQKTWAGWKLATAMPAATVPLRWELAYGGDASGSQAPWMNNPVGCGHIPPGAKNVPPEFAAPQLELPGDPVRQFGRPVRSVGCTPLERAWPNRARLAGTFDESWLRDRCPLLPDDFQDDYWNFAPEPLRSRPYIVGGEECEFLNLRPGGGVWRCRLPALPAIIAFVPVRRGQALAATFRVDTLLVNVARAELELAWKSIVIVPSALQAGYVFMDRIPHEWFSNEATLPQ